MHDPEWRGTNPFEERKPLRDFIRKILPNNRTVTDIDLAYYRWYPNNGGAHFRLFEEKANEAELTSGQRGFFRFIDSMLREADPIRARYLGFYLLQPEDPEWKHGVVTVTRLFEEEGSLTMELEEFALWLDD